LRPGSELSTILSVVDQKRIQQFLEPFGLDLTATQAEQTLVYLTLLLRWNQRINLTAIRDPDACVIRHFGESLFVGRHIPLHGRLLDIGSGAGFPGLALKITFPQVSVTLLEPVAKKRAFLKEAARMCGFSQAVIRPERLEDLVHVTPPPTFDFATMRAVGNLEVLVPLATQILKPNGSLLLWLTHDQTAPLATIEPRLRWSEPLPIPLSRSGEVWHGTRMA
jgi:16S rRNA (guanine527-N7)-methyltransferase